MYVCMYMYWARDTSGGGNNRQREISTKIYPYKCIKSRLPFHKSAFRPIIPSVMTTSEIAVKSLLNCSASKWQARLPLWCFLSEQVALRLGGSSLIALKEWEGPWDNSAGCLFSDLGKGPLDVLAIATYSAALVHALVTIPRLRSRLKHIVCSNITSPLSLGKPWEADAPHFTVHFVIMPIL